MLHAARDDKNYGVGNAWRNKYIDLISSKPDLIIECPGREMPAEGRERLRRRTSEFERCIVELGSGSGGHLLEHAARDSRTLFAGFELRFKRIFRAAEKAEARGLHNIILVHFDARRLDECFEPGTLDGFYVNFPDPWEKRRWEKHRLVTAEFLTRIARLLRPNGFISFKTDRKSYFDAAVESAREVAELRCEHAVTDLYATTLVNGNVASEFEKLFRSKELPVFHALWIKRS